MVCYLLKDKKLHFLIHWINYNFNFSCSYHMPSKATNRYFPLYVSTIVCKLVLMTCAAIWSRNGCFLNSLMIRKFKGWQGFYLGDRDEDRFEIMLGWRGFLSYSWLDLSGNLSVFHALGYCTSPPTFQLKLGWVLVSWGFGRLVNDNEMNMW